MFVLMRDNTSAHKCANSLFEMECIGKYDDDMDAFNDMVVYYHDAIVSLGYADKLDEANGDDGTPQIWCYEDEALVADTQGYGIALKIFEV